MTFIFLDTNVILIHSVKVSTPDGKGVEHPFYKKYESFFRALAQATQNKGATIVESLTVFDECEKKIDKVVEDSIEKAVKLSENYLDFLSLVKNKARKRLKDFLELVEKPSIVVEKRDEIKNKKVVPLHSELLSLRRVPMERRWSDNDVKILADATYLLAENKYKPFYFCTTEKCLVVGEDKAKKICHIQDKIYSTLGFNTYFPNDLLRLI